MYHRAAGVGNGSERDAATAGSVGCSPGVQARLRIFAEDLFRGARHEDLFGILEFEVAFLETDFE